MLKWAVVILVVTMVSAGFGFFSSAQVLAGIAKSLLVIFIMLFIYSLLAHLLGGNRSPDRRAYRYELNRSIRSSS